MAVTAVVRSCDGSTLSPAREARPPEGPEAARSALAAAVEAHRRDGGYVWVHLDDPGPDDLAGVDAALGVHPLAVEDLAAGRQRPKLERYLGEHGGSLVLSLRPVTLDRPGGPHAAVETGEALVVVGDAWVLSVSRGDDADVVPRAAARLGDEGRATGGPGPDLGPVAVLHAVVDVVADDAVAVAVALEDEVQRLEERVFSTDRGTGTTAHIYALKREVLELGRSVRPLVEPARRLWQGDLELVPHGARVFLRDVADHVLQAAESADGSDRQLGDVHSAHLAQVGLQQNEDARRISAWAALFAVPTLVAGVYGMNFVHMPELQWRYGYPGALLLMVVVCLLLHRAFRRSGWL